MTKLSAANENKVLEALEKAHRYFQPKLSTYEEQYRDEAHQAVIEAIKSIVPDYEKWEKKRVLKETIKTIENAYKTGLIKE